jgi:hypothetical protein
LLYRANTWLYLLSVLAFSPVDASRRSSSSWRANKTLLLSSLLQLLVPPLSIATISLLSQRQRLRSQRQLSRLTSSFSFTLVAHLSSTSASPTSVPTLYSDVSDIISVYKR